MATRTQDKNASLTLGIAGLAAMATYLDTTILFVAFPGITASFDTSSTSTLSWVLNAYTIVFAALLVPAGKLADRFGHRRAFLVGSATFSMASLACGIAPSAELLIGARVVQGAGAAILVPASLALVMAAFPKDKLPQVIAIWGAIGALSAALGPSLGALIIEAFGWRWAFFINLPVGVATIVAGTRYLQESRDPLVRIPSLAGVALLAGAASAILFGLVESDNVGWASWQTIGFGSRAARFSSRCSSSTNVEPKRRRSTQNCLPSVNFRWGNLAMLSFNMSFTAMFFGLILFLVNVWEWSILKAGLGVAPGPALAAVFAARFGKLAGEIGQRPLVILGGLVAAASGFYRLLLLDEGVDYLVDFGVPLFLSAIAIGLVFPQVTSVAVQAVPGNRVGVGGATTQAVRQFGGSLGVALTITLLGSATDKLDLVAGFNRIWWLVIVGGVATTLFALPLRTGRAAI